MVVVVSDTSPIRALCHLNRLELLRDLFGVVIIPPAVADELALPFARGPAIDARSFDFLSIREPADRTEVERLCETLDPGESEALALAEEIGAQLVLMDEAAGRETAAQLGFLVVGTCGILLRARQRMLIENLKPLLDDLIENLGFFVSEELKLRVLEAAGEPP